MPARFRLDQWLVNQGYFPSRQQAQRAVQAGQVWVNGVCVDKPGSQVLDSIQVKVQTGPLFVSRGGEKLVGALQAFPITVKGRICLDAGISTGGFTDCLLQQGAAQVYGVDVGYGQVAWSLRTDPRVKILERTNIRHLTAEQLYGAGPAADLATVDLSFISLSKVLPVLWTLLIPPREVLLLVKPQFEAGRDQVGKKGVVRDPRIHATVLEQVLQSGLALGWLYHGHTWSPALGPAGNIEFWLWLSQHPTSETVPEFSDLLNTCYLARETLITASKHQQMLTAKDGDL